MVVLFILLGDETHPCSRIRVFQYIPCLGAHGILPRYYYGSSRLGRLGYFVRLMRNVVFCDVVFIQRCPLSFVVMNIIKLFKKRVIFDFDDAIYLRGPRGANQSSFYCRRFQYIMQKSDLVIAGNSYLADYARQYQDNVVVIPSVIDVDACPVKLQDHSTRQVIIGWIGTEGNLFYVEAMESIFARLVAAYGSRVTFRVVSSKPGNFSKVSVEFRPWSLALELDELAAFDIGIMPLADDAWTRGKCGYKALQYMAVGVPCVCSPVGVLVEIVQDGGNGFLARTDEEWFQKISCLIDDVNTRQTVGINGRKTVESSFSLRKYISVMRNVLTNSIE